MNASYKMCKGYLYVRVTGDFIAGNVPEGFWENIDTARERGLNRMLCDITGVAGLDADRTTLIDRFIAYERFARSFPTDFSVAFLTRPEQLREDRFGETVLFNRGIRAKATADRNEALKWLGVSQTCAR